METKSEQNQKQSPEINREQRPEQKKEPAASGMAEEGDAVDRLAEAARENSGRNGRQVWASLDAAGKRQYFADYILPRLLKTALAAAVVFFLLWNFVLKEKDSTALYVAALDETFDQDECGKLQEKLESLMGDGDSSDLRNQIILDDSKNLENDGMSQLETLLFNHQVDVIIAERDTFRTLAADGDLLDLTELLTDDEQAKWEDFLVSAPGYLDSDDPEADGVGKGAEAEYGLSLSESPEYQKLSEHLTDPVLGIAENSERLENAHQFVGVLMEGVK